jgi:hypothetical protein
MPVVYITTSYTNASNQKQHRIEARHHKSLKKSEKDQVINASGVSARHTRRLLARLAETCKPA